MNRTLWTWLALLSFCWLGASEVWADQAEDEAAIRKTVESYTAAFNKQDAKALAAHWLPEAVYIDQDDGISYVGRAAIEKHFAEEFKELKNAKLAVATQSIKFLSTHVAVEQGTASILGLDKEPTKTEYTAIYIKRDGKWLLDRVTEEDIPEVVTNYDKLKELEWMIGSWVDDEDNATIETTCNWAKNQNFLIRAFSISVRDQIAMSGMQIIGWDPVGKHIRSWGFDSNGGFAEGVWTRKGKTWRVQIKQTMASGQQASAVNIFTYIDKNRFTWQSVDREIGDQLLPNVSEMTVIRKTVDE